MHLGSSAARYTWYLSGIASETLKGNREENVILRKDTLTVY